MPQSFDMNKDNWSGERTILTVQDDGTFEVGGYKFRLDIKEDVGNNGVSKYDLTIAKLVSTDGSWAHPLAIGTKFAKDNEWTFVSGDIVREHTNPHIAAAAILFNIL
jgi:hypothetical protein